MEALDLERCSVQEVSQERAEETLHHETHVHERWDLHDQSALIDAACALMMIT